MKKSIPKLLMLVILLLCPFGLFARSVDPTRPPADFLEVSKNETGLLRAPRRLTAIFNYPNYNLAIIDNHIVKQGDRLGEYVVTIIKKNEVELTGLKNKRIMLKLSPSVKQLR